MGRNRPKTPCSVSGCERTAWVGELCSLHYNRKRTTGTTAPGRRPHGPLSERVWNYIDKRGPDECWPWTGFIMDNGYGTIGSGGQYGAKVLAHRAAWESAKGPIPERDDLGWHGVVVMHTCDNRACCNPAHLRLGTHVDNMADMVAKNRQRPYRAPLGQHPRAKITEETARAILCDERPQRMIAEAYGVNISTVQSIKQRKTWRHL